MLNKRSLKDYEKIVGQEVIEKIEKEVLPIKGKKVLHINSTLKGGGVAEMLQSLIPLMSDTGLDADWKIINAPYEFFTVTKKFHNSLQGEKCVITQSEKKLYEKWNKINSKTIGWNKQDIVIIHDPQPAALIKYTKKICPWIWRCHIDLSSPYRKTWNYIKTYIKKYDAMVVSMWEYKKGLIKEYIIPPSIDPLTDKNRELSEKEQHQILKKYKIDLDKPIIAQISRFDKWKDPLGVIEAFKIVKKKVDCKLVLMGNMARDDPEGPYIYEKVLEKTEKEKDVQVVIAKRKYENDILVNTLQRVSSVIIQKSLREGFALTVSEALWKGTPVVGGNVGGIPLQIKNGKNGFLINSIEDCAKKVIYLLKNKRKAAEMGKFGKEYVRKNFLITRHLLDYIRMFKDILKIKS